MFITDAENEQAENPSQCFVEIQRQWEGSWILFHKHIYY